MLNIPLMHNNITRDDRDVLIEFLKGDPILTQSSQVSAFEKEWSDWLGVKYSVFVNSGASANLITIAALKHIYGLGDIIVPTLTWVSDIASVIQNGFRPKFVDINPKTLGMDENEILSKLSSETVAVFLTHVLGYNALTDRLLEELARRKVHLIEDVCESHGATHRGRKLGTYGLISNFSFYYAHHMSTIEGGMVCTDDEKVYEVVRMMRSHGMVREASSEKFRRSLESESPECNPEFIFAYPAYNVRSTEINAVIGRNQLKRLDANNEKRRRNLKVFLEGLDPKKYQTEFHTEGSVNYAFTLIVRKDQVHLTPKVMTVLKENGVEYRRGLSGGGNQLRQPYLRPFIDRNEHKKFQEVEHVHENGFYIGNYPDLSEEKVHALVKLLNSII